ncbi:MAG: hypothetical protein ACLFR7_02635 [Opitutales bacterium]
MPSTTEHPVTLEKLLRLKRHEVPDAEFWSRFDRDLERRRLRALVQDGAEGKMQGRWTRGRLLGGLFATAASVAALGALVLVQEDGWFLAPVDGPGFEEVLPAVAQVSPGPLEARLESMAAVDGALSPPGWPDGALVADSRFVVDSLSAAGEHSHFLRIHANPVFSEVRRDGAQFVADAFTAGNRASATFLTDRPRGQF